MDRRRELVGVVAVVVLAIAATGCGRTGLLTCQIGAPYLCGTPTPGGNKVVCDCECDASVFGVFKAEVNVCLPPELNSDTANDAQKASIAAMTPQEYASAVDSYCVNVAAQTIDTISHADFDVCGIGSCKCTTKHQPNDVTTVKNDSCITPCGTDECTFGEGGNCVNVLGDGELNVDNCRCNVSESCGFRTPPFCLREPGSMDPPTNDWSFVGEMRSGKSTVALDDAQSSLTVTARFKDDLQLPHSSTRSAAVHGTIEAFGLRHADGTADLILDFGLFPDDLTFHYTLVNAVANIDVHVTKLSIGGGTGRRTIHLDSGGHGSLPPGALALRVEALEEDQKLIIDSFNQKSIQVFLSFDDRTFMMSASLDFSDVQGEIVLVGTIVSQPPRAVAGPAQIVECASPVGTQVTLDASSSMDPDGDINSFSWFSGARFEPSAIIVSTPKETPYLTVTAPLGLSYYTVSANDSKFLVDRASTSVLVSDTAPPEVSPPPDLIVECTSAGGQSVVVGTAIAIDACDSTVVVSSDAPSLFMPGTTTITWTATDASGNSTSRTSKVSVLDNTPATLMLVADPSLVWPPNHQLTPLHIAASVVDACGPVSIVLISAIAVDTDGTIGDGIQGAVIGEPDFDFLILAERSGSAKAGRRYIFTYEATDSAGNRTRQEVSVLVPHDIGGGK